MTPTTTATSSPCTAAGNEQLTVNKASPTIATALSSATITTGGTANDTSNLTGDSPTQGPGTVAYSYYTNNACTTGQVAVNTVTVPTSGNVPNSNSVDLHYCWHVLLAGGLQRRRQQQRRLEHVHILQQRATDGDQGHADADSERPDEWHDRDRHHGGQHQLDPRRLLGLNASGTITFKVFAQATAPTTCTTGGTTVGTATVNNGNTTYTSSAGYTPTGAGNYWGTPPMAATPTTTQRPATCGGDDVRDDGGQSSSPTVTVGAPGTGPPGPPSRRASSTPFWLAASTSPAVTGTITFTVFAQTTAPTTCTTGGDHGGHGHGNNGNATYSPTTGYTPTTVGNCGGTRPTAVTPTTTLRPRPVVGTMSKTVVGLASPTVTASGPATGAAGTAITVGNISSTLGRLLGPQRHAAPSPSRSSPRPPPRPPAPPGAPRWARPRSTRQRHLQPDGRLHADDRRNCGGTPSYTATPTTTLRPRPVAGTMSKTVVVQSTPTVTANVPATGTAGTAITAGNITATLGGSSGSNATGTITFTVFGPLTTAPTTCTTGRHHGGHGHGRQRQRHLHLVGRLHAAACR